MKVICQFWQYLKARRRKMEILNNFPLSVDKELIMQKLKIKKGTEDEKKFEQLLNEGMKIGNPKVVYIEGFIDELGEKTVKINGIIFESKLLRKNLEKVGRVFPFIATSGMEMENKKFGNDDFLEKYWWDIIKEQFLFIARDHLIEYLKKNFSLGNVSIMSPGSGELGLWRIEEQKKLFSLFGDTEKLIGVKLTDSNLMIPNKSVSGIIFSTEKNFNTCKLCSRKNCPHRKAEFEKVFK